MIENIEYLEWTENAVGQNHPTLDDTINRPLKELIAKLNDGASNISVHRTHLKIDSATDITVGIINDDLVYYDEVTSKFIKAVDKVDGIIDVDNLLVYTFGDVFLIDKNDLVAGNLYYLSDTNAGEMTTDNTSGILIGRALDTNRIFCIAGASINTNTLNTELSRLSDNITVNFTSDSDLTLDADENQYGYLFLTDTSTFLTGSKNVIIGDNARRVYVKNNTNHDLTVKTSGGTGITITSNNHNILYCDGTNVIIEKDNTTTTREILKVPEIDASNNINLPEKVTSESTNEIIYKLNCTTGTNYDIKATTDGKFIVYDATNTKDVLVYDSSSNRFGVFTPSPMYPLHVTGILHVDSGRIETNTTNSNWRLGSDFGPETSGDFIFYENQTTGQEKLRIKKNGDLVIQSDVDCNSVTYSDGSTQSVSGKLLQVVRVENNTVITSSASIPHDGTVPLYNEGYHYSNLNISITPKSNNSTFIIKAYLQYVDSATNEQIITGLWDSNGATDPAIYSTRSNSGQVDEPITIVLNKHYSNTTTTAKNFYVRLGGQGSSWTLNKNASENTISNIEIWEISNA